MHRNVTAIYRTYQTADLVRTALTDLGISRSNIHVVPDTDEAMGASGYRDDDRYIDQLHALALPDDDLRTYQQSVRRGDYVVSAEVDEDYVARVQEIMRRPESETYNFDTRSSEFGEEELMVPSTAGTDYADRRGERDTTDDDPYTRSYRRNAPLGGRME